MQFVHAPQVLRRWAASGLAAALFVLCTAPASAYRVSIDAFALADTADRDADVDDPVQFSQEGVPSLSTNASAAQAGTLGMSATSKVSGTARIGAFSGVLNVTATSSPNPDDPAAALGQTNLDMSWEDAARVTGPGGPGAVYTFAAVLRLSGTLVNTANIPGSTASIFSAIDIVGPGFRDGMSVFDILEIGSRQTVADSRVVVTARDGDTLRFFARAAAQAVGGASAGQASAEIAADFPHTVEFFLDPLDGGSYTTESGVSFASAQVPLPATLPLVLAGIAAIGATRRRRADG